MSCRKLYKCLFSGFCCQKNTTIIWTTEDDNALVQNIISGYNLDEICLIMNMPKDMIEYRIIDNMSKYNNYEATYHMGPGTKYVNYIEFIKNQYQYESL